MTPTFADGVARAWVRTEDGREGRLWSVYERSGVAVVDTPDGSFQAPLHVLTLAEEVRP